MRLTRPALGFNGGPRVYKRLGLALMNADYVRVGLLQKFDSMENLESLGAKMFLFRVAP